MRFNHYGVIGEIDSLPGCSQVAVFHSVFNPTERQKGRGRQVAAVAAQLKQFYAARIDQARFLGYNAAMCTVNMDNEAQLKILEKAGWNQVHSFNSIKTGHTVGIFVKEI